MLNLTCQDLTSINTSIPTTGPGKAQVTARIYIPQQSAYHWYGFWQSLLSLKQKPLRAQLLRPASVSQPTAKATRVTTRYHASQSFVALLICDAACLSAHSTGHLYQKRQNPIYQRGIHDESITVFSNMSTTILLLWGNLDAVRSIGWFLAWRMVTVQVNTRNMRGIQLVSQIWPIIKARRRGWESRRISLCFPKSCHVHIRSYMVLLSSFILFICFQCFI
jgi:hypothetical protein